MTSHRLVQNEGDPNQPHPNPGKGTSSSWDSRGPQQTRWGLVPIRTVRSPWT